MPENKKPGNRNFNGPRRNSSTRPGSNSGGSTPRTRTNRTANSTRGPRNQAASSANRPSPQVALPVERPDDEFESQDSLYSTGPEQPEYVTIAQITAPFGLRGAVKATIRTDFPDRFEQLEEVYIAPPGAANIVNWERKQLLSAKLQNDKVVVLRFEGLTKVEQVESLRGYNVAVPYSETVPLPEGEYYIFQIIGLDVYSTEDVYIGKVVNVERMPANDVYSVRGPLSKNDVLIPAVKDIVKNIDLDTGRMTIELLEGLV
ncbi:MAG: 16S rRNA processing protein RimM [Chloroflexi bacterium]|nr:16S rRNA processing protein RimM [Chloroflexota bacterium]